MMVSAKAGIIVTLSVLYCAYSLARKYIAYRVSI